jgi:hypothetical protein
MRTETLCRQGICNCALGFFGVENRHKLSKISDALTLCISRASGFMHFSGQRIFLGEYNISGQNRAVFSRA